MDIVWKVLTTRRRLARLALNSSIKLPNTSVSDLPGLHIPKLNQMFGTYVLLVLGIATAQKVYNYMCCSALNNYFQGLGPLWLCPRVRGRILDRRHVLLECSIGQKYQSGLNNLMVWMDSHDSPHHPLHSEIQKTVGVCCSHIVKWRFISTNLDSFGLIVVRLNSSFKGFRGATMLWQV